MSEVQLYWSGHRALPRCCSGSGILPRVPRYEAALVDLQFAWKMPRSTFDELRACRRAVQHAYDNLSADMQESVEVGRGAYGLRR